MQVTINGELKNFEAALSISALLESLAVPATQVAVELNGDIVPKSSHAQVTLQDGDVVELVRFIGGG